MSPAVTSVDPELALVRTLDLRSARTASLGQTRAVGWLVSIFAVLALVLAAVGLFGTLAFTVERRRRELGIRTALGAPPSGLVRLVMGSGLGLTAVGILVGTGVSWAVVRGLRSFLFGVGPADPAVTAGTAALLLAMALSATWIPARRATRTDPVRCLREER